MQTCCGCFELRTGGIIIGVLQMITAIYGTFTTVKAITIYNNIQAIEKNHSYRTDLNGNNTSYDIEEEAKYGKLNLSPILLVLLYFGLCLTILHFFFALFLVLGITMRKTSFLTGWIGYNCLSTFYLTITGFIFIGLMKIGDTDDNKRLLLGIPLKVYYIYVIIQLRKKIKEEVDCQESGNGQVTFASQV